jgi:hypothetical protein
MEFVDFCQIVTIEMISMTFAFLITTNSCVFGATFLGAVFVRLIIAFTVDENSIKEIRSVCLIGIEALKAQAFTKSSLRSFSLIFFSIIM